MRNTILIFKEDITNMQKNVIRVHQKKYLNFIIFIKKCTHEDTSKIYVKYILIMYLIKIFNINSIIYVFIYIHLWICKLLFKYILQIHLKYRSFYIGYLFIKFMSEILHSFKDINFNRTYFFYNRNIKILVLRPILRKILFKIEFQN